MTDPAEFIADVRAIMARYLDGQVSGDTAIALLTPVLRQYADAERNNPLWPQRAPGGPVRLKELTPAEWQDPFVGRGGGFTFTPVPFAPGRPPADEEKAVALFEEACRRTFGDPSDAV